MRQDGDEIERALVAQAMKIGKNWLERRLAEKLRAAGVEPKPKLLKSLVAQISTADTDDAPRTLEDLCSELPGNLTLEFTDAELADLEATLDRFQALMPGILSEFTTNEAERLFKTLKARWPDEYKRQRKELHRFAGRLDKRWGEGLNLLRMLLTVAREIGGERLAYDARKKADRHLRQVLSRLHARACQITMEIIVLLENGFADGAMARWRTMHEIYVVAAVVAQGGDNLAERYIEHQKIEARRGLEDYEDCYQDLGYKPLPKADVARIRKAYDKCVARYGHDFAKAYGWAAEHVRKVLGLSQKQNITFGHLQTAAKRSVMQSHYRMASHNVHAGPHGIYFKLGQMGYSEVLLAGASNAGLVEPAQNAALSLSQITALLFPKHPTAIDLIGLKSFERIREAIPETFLKAERKLGRDHAAVLKAERTE